MSKFFDDIYQGLSEALLIEKGEIELMPHPAQDRLPAPTFIAVPRPEDTETNSNQSKDQS